MGGIDPDEYKKDNGKDSKIDRKAQTAEYMKKPLEEMTERDWRIFREDQDIMIKGGRVPHPIRSWDEIQGLDPILRDNIAECGYPRPMPIQMQSIPIGTNYRDMIGLAPTGSGKSAAFLIPLINFLLKMPPIKDELI